MRKWNQNNKKTYMRVIMFIMAILMILSFVVLPAASRASAAEVKDVVVKSFDTGRLADAIEKAKDGTDLNQITSITVKSGTLNAADYGAILGYPNIVKLELSGCDTENGIIPENALASRNQLSYVSMPKNTKVIATRAFSNNKKLETAVYPASLEEIGDYAFESCEALDFLIPSTLTKLGEGAFRDCKALTKVELPEAITEIPAYCFTKSAVKELVLGPQVTRIGDGAFSDCYDLKDIYFYGDTAPAANEGVFQNIKADFHTYADLEGFGGLNSNFVNVSDDMDEAAEYIPPQNTAIDSIYEETNDNDSDTDYVPEEDADIEETTLTENSSDKNEETTKADNTEKDKSDETTAADTTAAEPASANNAFSGPAVAIIAVLAAALAVTVTLLVVNKKKN